MDPFRTHGAISWPELHTSDAAAAADFYKAIFGWELEAMDMGYGMYHVGKIGGIPMSGMMKAPMDDVPPCWILYITVDDVDAVVSRATELGGQNFVPAMDVPEVGRFAGIADPGGAIIFVMKWDQLGPAVDYTQSFVTPGQFSWFQLQTPDVEGSISFYTQLFGWNTEVNNMGTGPYNIIKIGDVGFGGVIPPMDEGIPAHWAAYVTVEDADATAEAVQANGGTVVAGPFDVETVGRMVAIQDPQGAHLLAIAYVPMPE
ncbi:MAG: VOC family protein [Rhodothermales bacterium]|nr:VOC family protein [Rhodothermales bacterium]MBO6779229.1 VOC family protein [Rhodothermales bacterium]